MPTNLQSLLEWPYCPFPQQVKDVMLACCMHAQLTDQSDCDVTTITMPWMNVPLGCTWITVPQQLSQHHWEGGGVYPHQVIVPLDRQSSAEHAKGQPLVYIISKQSEPLYNYV